MVLKLVCSQSTYQALSRQVSSSRKPLITAGAVTWIKMRRLIIASTGSHRESGRRNNRVVLPLAFV